jgi:CubicO group peptidase (beta-lactamase class C family)
MSDGLYPQQPNSQDKYGQAIVGYRAPDCLWKSPAQRVRLCYARGLFLSATDLAKLGYLYLHDGIWDGRQIVSKDWVKNSLVPSIDVPFTLWQEEFRYGYLWWLVPRADRQGYAWEAAGLV